MTYDYNASALGLGGVLRHANGTTTNIPSLASVHLAPTGGHGDAKITGYNEHGVSFTMAHSTVVGVDSGRRTFTTSSDVLMTDLNLFGRIQVSHLQTGITCTRNVFQEDSRSARHDPDSGHFSMRWSIAGLRIDGVAVSPEFDFELTKCATHEQFTNRIRGADDGVFVEQFGVEQAELDQVLTDKVQPIRGSFVRALSHAPTGRIGPYKAFRLPVRNFGYVHFGELVVKPGRRRVNLLRIEFDSTLAFWKSDIEDSFWVPSISPYGGSMTIASLANNGAPSWP